MLSASTCAALIARWASSTAVSNPNDLSIIYNIQPMPKTKVRNRNDEWSFTIKKCSWIVRLSSTKVYGGLHTYRCLASTLQRMTVIADRNMYKLDLSLHLIQSGLCKYNIKQSTILEEMVTYVPNSQQFEIMPSPNQISCPLLFCSKSQWIYPTIQAHDV
jgi:hypothetical protein